MSRIGRTPITIPAGVSVTVDHDNSVYVNGPNGELAAVIHSDIIIDIKDNILTVSRPSDSKLHRSLHGLARSIIHNMVTGVTHGFSKNLVISGVGYRAALIGNNLSLNLGYSHPVIIAPPNGISFAVPNPTSITVSGIDKQLVGSVAAHIRSCRLPEPYKGKGILYDNEHIRRKVGKAGSKK